MSNNEQEDNSGRSGRTAISIHAVNAAAGVIAAAIDNSTKWAPDDCAMNSVRQHDAAVKAFAGEEWSRAEIPQGMENSSWNVGFTTTNLVGKRNFSDLLKRDNLKQPKE